MICINKSFHTNKLQMSIYNRISSVFISENKIQYCKQQLKRGNFRFEYTDKDLDNGIIVNFPHESTYFSCKALTSSVILSRRFERAGVIPYTIIDGKKYFCLGVDFTHGTLTDFGGGIKKYETFARAAARELCEESLGIFRFSPTKIYNSSYCIHDNSMIIIFLRLSVENLNESVKDFQKRFSKVTRSENSGIMWIQEEIFYNLIKTGKSLRDGDYIYPAIYKPVTELLQSVYDPNGIV